MATQQSLTAEGVAEEGWAHSSSLVVVQPQPGDRISRKDAGDRDLRARDAGHLRCKAATGLSLHLVDRSTYSVAVTK